MKKTTRTVEWIGSIVPMPAVVNNESETYHPEGLFWLDADGLVQGMAVERPGALLPIAGTKLREAIRSPMCGGDKPTRIRVDSSELAAVLRKTHPSLDIVCAPVPELDEMMTHMRETMGGESMLPQSYLSPGIGKEQVGAFFDAAAELFRAEPWKIVPDDQCLLEVSIDALDLRDAVICVIGQMGESFGFLLFPGIAEFDAYAEVAASSGALGTDPQAPWPPFLSLNFEPAADLDPQLRKEIAQHSWQVAGRNAYPWSMALEPGLLPRPLAARELRMVEAICRALVRLMAKVPALRTAWASGNPVNQSATVPTREGKVEVVLRTLIRDAEIDDPILELLHLEAELDELTPEDRAPFEDALLHAFAASPEGSACTLGGNSSLVMDLAADYLGVTIGGLNAKGLGEILFEILPRKVSIAASESRAIVAELRAFYQFLKRVHDLNGADDCLRVLGSKAAAKLEKALSDSSQFGMAKSLLMTGKTAGFDMGTQEGIEAWMRSIQGKPLPASIQMPSAGLVPTATGKALEAAKARKKQGRQPKNKPKK